MNDSPSLPNLGRESISGDLLHHLIENGIALTQQDMKVIKNGPYVTASLVAVAAIGARSLSYLADLSTALAIEALQGSASVFDPKLTDVGRPHPGQVLSATTLRLLLHDSTECRKDKFPHGFGNDGFDCAHEIHGPIYTASMELEKTAKIELNAVPFEKAVSPSAGEKPHYHSFPIFAPTVATTKAVAPVISAISQRASILGYDAEEANCIASKLWELANIEQPIDCQSRGHTETQRLLLDFFHLLGKCQSAFSQELGVSDFMLASRESAALSKQKQKADARKKQEAEKAQKEKNELEKKLAACSSQEEKDEVLKKEKKAAEKRAQKAAKAAKKTSAGALLGLGAGTRELRSMLYRTAEEREPTRSEKDEHGFTPVIELPKEVFMDGLQLWTPAITDKPIFEKVERLLDEISSGGARRRPKIPKGTRDFAPEQMEVREKAFTIIKNVFKRHGAVEIDTPVFERRETLLGKYGEEGGKLIYDLADQGGESLCLRYDLTVPFARYVAMNKIQSIKRYHISKVYRRDQPNITKGRYREFYQCDLDIAGSSSIPMLPDAEVIKVACEILQQLPIGSFEIKVNHRGLLDAMLQKAGVPQHKFKTICSSIDKLDKESWEHVRHEMVVDKGLEEPVADEVGKLVLRSGKPKELLEDLKGSFGENNALWELSQLFEFLEDMKVLELMNFELSLARGLDYYTGVIYEAVLTDPSVAVGSIAAGGRYDNLVGMFSASGEDIPCVGVSIGIERIFAIMEEEARKKGGCHTSPVNVFVASAGKEELLIRERVKICSELWNAGISAKTSYSATPKMDKQLSQALKEEIPFIVIVGANEVEAGTVMVKNLKEDSDSKENCPVPRSELPAYLLKQMSS